MKVFLQNKKSKVNKLTYKPIEKEVQDKRELMQHVARREQRNRTIRNTANDTFE